MIRRALPLSAATLLFGCAAAGGSYPSLAPRAAERHGFEEPVAAGTAPARPDPALDARIAAATADTSDGETFAHARAAAAATVATAASAPAGSDAWLDAQVALGSLDVLRAAASEHVTALEELAADRAVAGDPPYPRLNAAVTGARARLAEVTAGIAELNARLRR